MQITFVYLVLLFFLECKIVSATMPTISCWLLSKKRVSEPVITGCNCHRGESTINSLKDNSPSIFILMRMISLSVGVSFGSITNNVPIGNLGCMEGLLSMANALWLNKK